MYFSIKEKAVNKHYHNSYHNHCHCQNNSKQTTREEVKKDTLKPLDIGVGSARYGLLHLPQGDDHEKVHNDEYKIREESKAEKGERDRQILDVDKMDNDTVKNCIRETFVNYVVPDNVVWLFHKYDANVLTENDVEHVKARTSTNGPMEGAQLLLNRLALYKNWFPCLIQVLKDELVKLGHVAEVMQDKVKDLKKSKVKWRISTNVKEYTGAHLETFKSRPVSCSEVEMVNEAKAERIRASRGHYEAEVSCTGEAGLYQSLTTCHKNPGHENFIPITHFSIDDLPSRYRDKLILNYVRATSDITCRLSVPGRSISGDRPETWPDSNQAFPFSAYKGENAIITGTGWVSHVVKFTEEDGINCKCHICSSPSTNTPKGTWGEVHLRTACHIVYDDGEARHTECHFWCSSHETDMNKVLKLTRLNFVNRDIKGDWCAMKYVTHDIQLLDEFDKMHRHWFDARQKVLTKYSDLPYKYPGLHAPDTECDKNFRHDLCIIVSHPHGCDKAVTVGKWTQRDLVLNGESGYKEITYSYNTPTCPGSGGALVITLVKDITLQDGLSHPLAHSPDRQGCQERERCCGMEVGIHKSIIVCKKNPNHEKFIPVEDFNIQHLPHRYHDQLIETYVKATSGIICRLSVPDISADSDQGADKEENSTTVGTGWVDKVVKYGEEDDENCRCTECDQQGTDTPKKAWGVVYVRTASHVVDTDEVASHTQSHLFYDSHELTLNEVPTLTGFKVLKRDIEGDWCEMTYVTHNVELLDKLSETCRQWRNQCSKVHHKYVDNEYPGVGCDTNVSHDLCIIVSHPHGCTKTVTVGKWTERHVVGKVGLGGSVAIKYSYDTPTCPGSSGAPVNTIAVQDWLSHPPAHSQGRDGNQNNSGVGLEPVCQPLT